MTHYEDVSLDALCDAMIEIAQEAMAAGFSSSKTINGKTIEEWATDFIRGTYDEDFGKDMEEPTGEDEDGTTDLGLLPWQE